MGLFEWLLLCRRAVCAGSGRELHRGCLPNSDGTEGERHGTVPSSRGDGTGRGGGSSAVPVSPCDLRGVADACCFPRWRARRPGVPSARGVTRRRAGPGAAPSRSQCCHHLAWTRRSQLTELTHEGNRRGLSDSQEESF